MDKLDISKVYKILAQIIGDKYDLEIKTLVIDKN